MNDAQAQMTDDEFNGHLSVVMQSLEDEVAEAPQQKICPRVLVISTRDAKGERTVSFTAIKSYANLEELHVNLAAIGYSFATTGKSACAMFMILETEAEVHGEDHVTAHINAISIFGTTIDGRQNMAILKTERTDGIIAALKPEAVFKSPTDSVSVEGPDPAASFWIEYIKKHTGLPGKRSDG